MLKFAEREEHVDVELNIVPIIDCFVMLICFLLFTAAFTQLVFLEAKLASNTAAAADKSRAELDQFRLIAKLEDGGIRLTATGNRSARENVFIPNVGDTYDFKALHRHVTQLKTKYPERYSIDIEVKTKRPDTVSYEKILKTIDAVRHLTDEEYAGLRLAQKKVKKMPITEKEAEKPTDEVIDTLGANLLANEVSAQADQKLLFPDVALLGVD
ncbi:MAG: biopolymer transporter ExbD [Bdellovibrionales bacterium]|nr:biopolymer transporter ExbD [Bdellovibrionales bacterium]